MKLICHIGLVVGGPAKPQQFDHFLNYHHSIIFQATLILPGQFPQSATAGFHSPLG